MLHNETHQTLFERWGKGERRNGNMEGVNPFKVHCMHAWNYHNEIPSYY
jgi:hypothetical protein